MPRTYLYILVCIEYYTDGHNTNVIILLTLKFLNQCSFGIFLCINLLNGFLKTHCTNCNKLHNTDAWFSRYNKENVDTVNKQIFSCDLLAPSVEQFQAGHSLITTISYAMLIR